jgi:hypothetical protein
MSTSSMIMGLSLLFLVVSSVLGKMMYNAFLTNTTASTRQKLIGAGLSIISVGAVGATTVATYQATGITSYAVNASGIIIQGSAQFKITSDPYGLFEVTNIDWGTIKMNEKHSKTLYTINTGAEPLNLNFELKNWNWVTTNPANEITVNMLMETTPLAPGRFRAIVFEMTVIKPLPSGDPANPVSLFKYDIIITGSNPPTNPSA